MERVALAGELALDGQVRPIHGVLAIAEAAREGGVETVVVPAENGPEAALAGGVEVVPLGSLAGLPALAAGERGAAPAPLRLSDGPAPGAPDLADLRGQPHLRHALEVAAAGGHSLLMIGTARGGEVAGREPPALDPAAARRGGGARGGADRQRHRSARAAGCPPGGRSARRTTRSAPPG